MENWYLACHKSGKHNALKAQMFLSQMGVEVFIPQVCYHDPRADRPGTFRKTIEPLFPGYIFLCFDYNEVHTSKIEYCPGISHLVRFGETIAPINDSMVNAIMKLTLSVYPNASESCARKKRELPLSEEMLTSGLQDQDVRALIEERDGVARSMMLCRWISPRVGANDQ